MAIRYDKELNKEINRVIKNYNQKLARLTNLQSDYILPQKITKSELKQSVYTRRELKNKLNELRRFSKRGAEETVITSTGVTTSRYELENLKREASKVKRSLTIQLKKLEETNPTVFGKKQGYTFAQMGDSLYLNIKSKREYLEKDILKLEEEKYLTYQNVVKRLGRSKVLSNILFQENIDTMINTLAYHTGYDEEKIKILKEKFSKLSPDNFYKLFQNEKSIKSIIEDYDLITGRVGRVDPSIIAENVEDLYDDLINNIDKIIKDYL